MVSFVDKSDVKIIIEKNELKRHLSLTEDKVIMFIGRFSNEKGVDVLVKAFKELHSMNKKISLIMIGEGEEEKSLRHYSSENKLPVQLLSPRTNIFDYYNIADIIVLPSRVDPFPYVMLEAGLMNKPFVGSNVDGISELIKHGVNGLLFESENVGELINSIQMVFKDQELAKRISQNFNNDIITNYSLEKVIHEYSFL